MEFLKRTAALFAQSGNVVLGDEMPAGFVGQQLYPFTHRGQ